ncbi:hypothetical protein Riv7116_2973 [Rivularia sp. PCC 7116]|uniref:formylglycine-generating enzyme family protein n=1 Tax=Rivularia sp. PCC 7116 TaxID=373994 RepID=UPI00029F09E1|nr:formylglycine-generating enzyme family protein [Rivularia sp. PCC 7116]AFY55454.1 hypothetical protein Riv7116_2973 [Rivularia sp. PCC 7116]
MGKIVINRQRKKTQYYIEELGNGINLEMVLIPSGNFKMGAPETEIGSSDRERPQHQVTIPFFFMGRYQITQAQWRAVANLPQLNRELKPAPSSFKGDNLPVEQISWYDAVEFCARLSHHTGRNYRLPSEAEWEYACRAGTTTPFHFGETITTDLANYRGMDSSYGNGTKGIYRQQTTPVGSFNVANNFGLSDMHGNVWEWCFDDWHNNYQQINADGRAWIEKSHQNKNDYRFRRILRGGSWGYNAQSSRSAGRLYNIPGYNNINIGLRIACGIKQ